MNHDFINDHQIVDRYLMGRLDEQQRGQFEIHYLDCEQCCDQIELGAAFMEGMHTVAMKEFELATTSRRWRNVALAASVLLVPALALSAWSTRELNELTQETGSLPVSHQSIVVMPLSTTRSLDTDPVNVIEVSSDRELFIFEIEGLFANDIEHLVQLVRENQVVWEGQVEPDYRGLLVVGIPSVLLDVSLYQVTVKANGTGSTVGQTFSLRVKNAQ